MTNSKYSDYEFVKGGLVYAFIILTIIVLSAVFTKMLINPQLNQTQTQLNETIDWIRENSEVRDIDGDFCKRECEEIIKINKDTHIGETVIRCLVDGCSEPEYFLIGTNISTERFFR